MRMKTTKSLRGPGAAEVQNDKQMAYLVKSFQQYMNKTVKIALNLYGVGWINHTIKH